MIALTFLLIAIVAVGWVAWELGSEAFDQAVYLLHEVQADRDWDWWLLVERQPLTAREGAVATLVLDEVYGRVYR